MSPPSVPARRTPAMQAGPRGRAQRADCPQPGQGLGAARCGSPASEGLGSLRWPRMGGGLGVRSARLRSCASFPRASPGGAASNYDWRFRMSLNPQVRLVPATVPLLTVLDDDRTLFCELIGSPIPDGWPEFPEAIGFTLEHL